MLKLHQYHLSPFNEKIRRMLNYKGIPFQEQHWQLGQRSAVRKLNPTGKLPALEHDSTWICDSTDIAWYLEETFPERPMIPTEPRLRGQVHVLEDWADESLYFYEMHLRFTTEGNWQRNISRMVENENAVARWLLPRVIPGGIRKITASQGIGRKSPEQLISDTARHVAAVDNLLHNTDWLVGDTITLADLAVYAMFLCFRDADMARALLEDKPNVMAWMQRIEQTTDTPTPPAASV